jgi:6-phosphogluconolactonase (cycloisomerase 2 family)
VYETAPHPHEALLDPTGNFILIPDLGADLIHLYRINSKKTLEALKPLQVPVGSGPRHAAFLVARSGTYFYVVSQLTNVLTAYGVTYNTNETLSFRPIFAQSLLKTGREVDFQAYSAAAEIHVTVWHLRLPLHLVVLLIILSSPIRTSS